MPINFIFSPETEDLLSKHSVLIEKNLPRWIKSELSKKKKNIDEREQDFFNSLIPYVDRYGKAMVRSFYNYWSERDHKQLKMRFEGEKFFDVGKRLGTWKRKDDEKTSQFNGKQIAMTVFTSKDTGTNNEDILREIDERKKQKQI